MKRNLKSFVAIVLSILMVVPFSTMAIAAQTTSDVLTEAQGDVPNALAAQLPAEPTSDGLKILYVKSGGTGDGSSVDSLLNTTGWNSSGKIHTAFADGAIVVAIGKCFVGVAESYVDATDTVVFTATDPATGTNYLSKDASGNLQYEDEAGTGDAGQLGMFMKDGSTSNATSNTFEVRSDVIFRDIAILNRRAAVPVYSVADGGKLVIESTCEIVYGAKATAAPILNVDAGGYAYLHNIGFSKYTGAGTIVIGDEIAGTVTPKMFAEFEGEIVNENGDDFFTALPVKPTSPSNNKVLYIANSSAAKPGVTIAPASTGGDTLEIPYAVGSAATWQNFFGTGKGKDGGTVVIVGKGYMSADTVLPATKQPVVFTGKYDGVDYATYDANNSYDCDSKTGQFGSLLLTGGKTLTIDGSVILDDVYVINRSTSIGTIQVDGKLVVKNNVGVATLYENKEHVISVSDGGVLFLDALGFGAYTGTGTIVVGNSIRDQIDENTFSSFAGKLIDEAGNDIVFDNTGDKVIFVSHDNQNGAGLSYTASIYGGDSLEEPLKTGGDWAETSLYTKAANGATIVVVGKFYSHYNHVFPETTAPITITGYYDNQDYVSKDENGNIVYMNEAGGNEGQFGMFIVRDGYSVTFDCDVIFDKTVILSRIGANSTAKAPSLIVNKSMTINDTVQFAEMMGDVPYNVVVNEGATLNLHALGFGKYQGTGKIVIDNDLVNTVDVADFVHFEGQIVDENGADVFTGEKALITGTSGECDYTYDWSTGVLTFTGNGAPAGLVRARFAKEIVFEEGVTAIPDMFCYNNTHLEKVTISSTVTSIGSTAFAYARNLTEVVIPADTQINSVGSKAFLQSGVSSLTFNNNLTNIGVYAFRNCANLTSLDLGNNVSTIGEYAFAYTDKLATVTVDGTFTSIPNYTFLYAKGLTGFEVPETVTEIGKYAFMNAQQLTTVGLPSGLITINADAFKDTGLTGTLELPATVETVADRAFFRSRNLTGLVLPEALTSIGAYTIAHTGITELNVPSNITEIPESAFNCAGALTTVSFGGDITAIGNYAFANSGLTSFVIPESVTTLGNGVFYGATKLASVTVNAPITELPLRTFAHATALSEISLSASVTAFGDFAFYNCVSLATIDLPTEFTTLGEYAFAKAGLTSITLPAGVTEISKCAFSDCASLQSVDVQGELTAIRMYAFSNSGITEFTIPETCTTLDSGCFINCASLVNVTINAPIKTIPAYMFQDCTALVSADIPATVEVIQMHAYDGCSSLADIEIPANLKYLYECAFADTSSLNVHIVLPGTLQTPPESTIKSNYNGAIGTRAFIRSGITGVTLSEGIESISYEAFYECRNITTVTIPSSCTVIGERVFVRTPLTDAYVPATVTSIGNLAFYHYQDDPIPVIHTEATATAVIEWANKQSGRVTVATDYVPAGSTAPETTAE